VLRKVIGDWGTLEPPTPVDPPEVSGYPPTVVPVVRGILVLVVVPAGTKTLVPEEVDEGATGATDGGRYVGVTGPATPVRLGLTIPAREVAAPDSK
jgi:hypothetical protein